MAIIKEVRGHVPVVGEGTFLAETAVLIGDVTVGRDCSIWYGAVLRGDVNSIRIGDRTNIQDGAVVHTLYDGAPHPSQAHIGSDVSIGHSTTPWSGRAVSWPPTRWCWPGAGWSPAGYMPGYRHGG